MKASLFVAFFQNVLVASISSLISVLPLFHVSRIRNIFLFLFLFLFLKRERRSNTRLLEIGHPFSPSKVFYVDGINTFWKNALYIFTSATHIYMYTLHPYIFNYPIIITYKLTSPCKYQNILLTSVFNLTAASGIIPSISSLNLRLEFSLSNTAIESHLLSRRF